MEKINIAELLKNCPKGMELDCTIFDTKVIYQGLSERMLTHPIVVQTEHGFEFELTQYGQTHNIVGSKCIIFPKGKTTWEGFVPPCQFKDGDIVSTRNGIWIGIIKEPIGSAYETYVTINGESLIYGSSIFCFERLATKKEKQKLFKAIKDNGYKWNSETKTLEMLEQPKFDITTLKPFDKVLVRDSDRDMWCASIFSHTWKDKYFCIDTWHKQCIPYEANKELLGTTNNPKEHGSN